MRISSAFLLITFASPCGGAERPAAISHSYMGRTGSQWKVGTLSVRAAGPLNTVAYAGGEYNISIAKTVMDAAGNLYAIGAQLVTVGSYTAHTVFVTKVDAIGATVYITWLGGKGDDLATGIGVDASGRVCGAGYTTSPDFPLVHAVQTEVSSQGTTGFVFALDASGALSWSTYWGGSGEPHGSDGGSVQAIAVDSAGDSYVTGSSQLPSMPTTAGAFQRTGNFGTVASQISNGFVAKFSPSGQVVYSTWLEGSLIDCSSQVCFYNSPRIDAGTAIAVDSAGSAYVAGYSDSQDFPVTPGAFQTTCNCNGMFESYHAFLTKLKPDGSNLAYSTLLGSSMVVPVKARNEALVIDVNGDAYVAFQTAGAQLAVSAGAIQTAPHGSSNVLVVEVNPSGSGLINSTYLGGSGDDAPSGIAVDHAGNVYLSGNTTSADFPDSYGQFAGGADFVTELNPSADKILFGTRLPGGLAAQDIVIDPATGTLVAAGLSGHILRLNPFTAASFPALLGAGNAANGTIDSTLPYAELVTIYGTGIGPKVTAQPTPQDPYPTSLAGVQVSFNNLPAVLIAVSSNQITAVVPTGLSSPISVQILNNGSTFGPITLAASSGQPSPGIFRNPDWSARALNQDGTVNGQTNPAHGGSIITIWGTGVLGLEGSEEWSAAAYGDSI